MEYCDFRINFWWKTITLFYLLIIFPKEIETLMTKHGSLVIFAIFCVLIVISSGQILVPTCNICQKCTFCSGDVLYDSQVDVLYNKIITNKPVITNAYPVTINKTVNSTGTIYFFQFSNNYNYTFIIKPKNTSITRNQIAINSSTSIKVGNSSTLSSNNGSSSTSANGQS